MAKTYSYVVLVEKKPICRGKNLRKMLKEVRRKYPKKTISIRYEYPKETLVALYAKHVEGKMPIFLIAKKLKTPRSDVERLINEIEFGTLKK